MSPRGDTLQGRVAAAAQLVRRRAQLSFALTTTGIFALVLLSTWLLGVRWPRPTALALVIDLLLVAVASVAVGYWRLVLARRLGRAAVATAAERRLGLDWGSLRGVLELDDQVPPGTSAALARRAEQNLQERTRGRSASDFAGDLGDRWRRRARGAGWAVGAAALSLAVLAFRAPERTLAGWAPLLHPVRQLRPAPLPALEVAPGAAQVARGEPLSVRIRAEGRELVALKWRLQGDVVHEQLLAVRNDSASGTTGAIAAAGSYWVEAPDGAESAHYPITPVDALLLGDLKVDVNYPAYLDRPADHYQGDVPPLELPAGTVLRISGRSTRPLSTAALQSGVAAVFPFAVSGRDFHGNWTPGQSGVYAWLLRDANGAGPAVAPAPLEISVTADRAPTVELTFPGVDTVLAADLRQPLTADAEDDHGVVSASLVSWRVRAGGGQDAPVSTPLDLGGSAERVQLATILDATGRALAPGDTLKYFVRVIDASPGGQSGVTGTYALRVPGADELRARARADARDVLERTTALQERAAELQRETRNTDRNTQAANARRGSRGNGSGGEPGRQSSELRFEETDGARRVLSDQVEVLDQTARLSADLADMGQRMAAAGLRDEDLQRRMDEVEKLLDRLATPELRRELKALQEALQQLDPAELQQVLARLARDQQEMKEQLDRAAALLREAEAAQELAALAQEARELATQQRALATAHEQSGAAGDSTGAAAQQQLAARGDSLARQLKQLAGQLRAQTRTGAAERADSAAGRVAAAQDSMVQAAGNAAARRGDRAAQEGRAAAEQLEHAAASLDDARREAADEREQEATETLDQATRDALALAQQQQALQQEMAQARQGQSQTESGDNQEQRPQPGDRAGAQGQSGQQNGRQPSQQQGAQQGGQRPEQGGGQQAGDERGSGQGGRQGGGKAGQPGGRSLSQMREEQRAVQQGLEQLGRNLSEEGQETGTVSRETSAALNRANTSMQETQQALEQTERAEQLPAEQAAQTVEALNRLALSLLQNAQQAGTDAGNGLQQARQQLAEAAQQQGSINGQGNSLLSLNLSPGAEADQVRRLGREQQALADRLAGMNDVLGGREDASGQVDLLAREAQALAQQMAGGRLTPDVAARQQRLFHKLLDAGRSLEQEETSAERMAERPGNVPTGTPPAVSSRLLQAGPRYRAPTPEELRLLPAGYRQLILDYFERLNRPLPPAPEPGR